MRARSITLALLLLIGVSQRPVLADDAKAQALRESAGGDAAYRAGRHEEALAHYQRAYALYPSPNLRFNLGLTFAAVGRHAEAIVEYEAFLVEAPDSAAVVRTHATEQIALLEKKVGRLAVSAPAGAQVSVDGKPVTAWPLRLDPGPHAVVVTLDGHSPWSEEVAVSAGETTRVDAAPAPMAREAVVEAEPAVAPEAPVLPAPGRGRRIAGLSVAASGVVLTGVGVYFAMSASSAQNDVEAAVARGDAWTDDLADQDDEGRRDATLGKVFIGVGAAALIGGGVLYFMSAATGDEPRADTALRIAPVVGAYTGAALELEF